MRVRLWDLRRSGQSAGTGNCVDPREQVVDLALLLALDDGRVRAGQPGVGVDGVQFTGFDQRGDDGPVFGAGAMGKRAGGRRRYRRATPPPGTRPRAPRATIVLPVPAEPDTRAGPEKFRLAWSA